MAQQKKKRVSRTAYDPSERNDEFEPLVWVHAAGWTFKLQKGETDEFHPDGTLILYMTNRAKQSITLPLAGWREDELRAIAYIFYKAFELGLPYSIAADVAMERKYEDGHDFQLRKYRAIPVVLSAEGNEPGDGSGVPQRPEPTLVEYRGDIDQIRVRNPRKRVADRQPSPVEGEDDAAESGGDS